MSRVAKNPVKIAQGVDVKVDGQMVTAKGPQGMQSVTLHSAVSVVLEEGELRLTPENGAWAMAGTMRALLNNLVVGVSAGFTRKLELRGVGYRAQLQGNKLNLSLGFSHPVEFIAPEGVTLEVPSQTEVIVKGASKQSVGQVAAKIRAYRPPEPYKGKGVRYADEVVIMKEAKKK